MPEREIERLKAAVSMRRRKKEVWICGQDFSFWMTPLTLGERSKARKLTKEDDVTEQAICMLVTKATDENGTLKYNVGDLPDLRNLIPAAEAEKLMLMLVREDEEDAELDMKSDQGSARKGQRAKE